MKNKWEEALISPETSILQTISIIDKTALQIALVVDRERKLLGTVTDGDIRRAILKGISLEEKVTQIMNTSPTVAFITDHHTDILRLMRKKSLHQIPILHEDGKVLKIEVWDKLALKEYDYSVILMAGGLGTRLRPLTDHYPKPMLKVGDKPILETILENFIEEGFRQFYITVNYKAEIIERYFGDGSRWGVNIQYTHEKQRLGTAGALSLLPQPIDKPVVVMNGDILTKVNFKQLLDFHRENQAIATMCVREYEHQVPYGVVKLNQQYVSRIEEKPVQRYFVNAGIYVLNPEALSFITHETFYDMPSLFEQLIADGKLTAGFPIREYWIDIGRMSEYNQANIEFNNIFVGNDKQ